MPLSCYGYRWNSSIHNCLLWSISTRISPHFNLVVHLKIMLAYLKILFAHLNILPAHLQIMPAQLEILPHHH